MLGEAELTKYVPNFSDLYNPYFKQRMTNQRPTKYSKYSKLSHMIGVEELAPGDGALGRQQEGTGNVRDAQTQLQVESYFCWLNW